MQLANLVIAVVCSTRDDPNFMLECIQAGASDYLLRPLRPDVIKTLFLVCRVSLSLSFLVRKQEDAYSNIQQ